MTVERVDVSFTSAGDEVAAWMYGSPGTTCVVMAHGFSLTRHDGLAPYADAALAWPGEADGFAGAVAPDSPWRNEIAPGVFATVAFHRPLARASQIACPLWVGLGERDITVDRKSVERFAARAPHSELHRYPYDHFEPFYGDAPARIAAEQVEFLRRQGLITSPA